MRALGKVWAVGPSFALSLCVLGCGGEPVPPAPGQPAAPISPSDTPSAPTADQGDQGKSNHNYNSYRYYGRGEDTAKGGYDASQKRGRDTWIMWSAGNQQFFRLGTELGGKLGVSVEYFRLLDSRLRSTRFARLGLINEPNCHEAKAPDEFGLWLDVWDKDPYPESYPDTEIYGLPSGVIGLRLFPNKKFDRSKWDVARYFKSPSSVEPPYRIAMSCAFCHMAFNPVNPPQNPAEPTWPNLAANLGNQYLHEGGIIFGKGRVAFGGENRPRGSHDPYDTAGLGKEDFLKHYGESQQRGTSETSRLSYDFINNPSVMNSIFYLHNRPSFPSETFNPIAAEEVKQIVKAQDLPPIHHVLKDGSDSQSIPIASIRVYVNEGLFGEYWIQQLFNPLTGKPQEPFDMRKARAESQDWRDTAERMPDLEKYLATYQPMHLADAPGGKAFIDDSLLARGKTVFAENCAVCHTSKEPAGEVKASLATLKGYLGASSPGPETDEVKKAREAVKAYYRKEVAAADFLEQNTLTDDVRYPVSTLGLNAARSLATNAAAGHIWDQFSSPEYKALPASGELTLFNPVTGQHDRKWKPPAGGRGYYRTASLVSIWATAPYLHNNSVGKYNGDPSVKGRIDAFNDGMRKLLWPRERLGIKSMKVIDTDGTNLYLKNEVLKGVMDELIAQGLPGVKLLQVPALPGSFKIPVPKGTPINLLANIHYNDRIPATLAYLRYVIKTDESRLPGLLGRKAAEEAKEAMDTLLKLSQYPDLIEDHGHTFGSDLKDDEKTALIEFLKTM